MSDGFYRDTVSSVGIIASRTLPFTNSNSSICTFRHALALDERRAKFRANYYHRTAPDEAGASKDPEHASPVATRYTDSPVTEHWTESSSSSEGETSEPREGIFRRLRGGKNKPGSSTLAANGVVIDAPTDVKEVWFTGVHTGTFNSHAICILLNVGCIDVGGGSTLDSNPLSLANISLRWMVREVINSQSGIQFDSAALARMGAMPNSGTGIKDFFPPATPGPVISTANTGVSQYSANEDNVRVGPDKSAKQKAENEVVGGDQKDLVDAKAPTHDDLKGLCVSFFPALVL